MDDFIADGGGNLLTEGKSVGNRDCSVNGLGVLEVVDGFDRAPIGSGLCAGDRKAWVFVLGVNRAIGSSGRF